MNNKWKKREGIVYSTSPDYKYQQNTDDSNADIKPSEQKLIIQLERKGRAGKTVTLITGFTTVSEQQLEDLGKMLKSCCGTGGSVKNGTILLQGDKRNQVFDILTKQGYRAVKSGC